MKKELPRCLDCGKQLSRKDAKRCHSCSRKKLIKDDPSLSIQFKYPNGYWINKKRNHNNDCQCPFCRSQEEDWEPWNKNKKMSIKARKNMSEAQKGKHFSEEARENMSKAQKKLWSNPEYKRKLSKERKNRYKNIEYKENWLKKLSASLQKLPNIPEQLVNCILLSLNLKKYKYVGDGETIIDGFNPDFINKKDKRIIEVYGDYWHNRPDYIIRDKRRLKSYTKYGYKTLIIWENELKDLDYAIGKILAFEEN